MQIFLDCIDAVKGSTGGTGFSAIKLTALGRPEILVGFIKFKVFHLHYSNFNIFDKIGIKKKLPVEVLYNNLFKNSSLLALL